jgi:hypothetical protein
MILVNDFRELRITAVNVYIDLRGWRTALDFRKIIGVLVLRQRGLQVNQGHDEHLRACYHATTKGGKHASRAPYIACAVVSIHSGSRHASWCHDYQWQATITKHASRNYAWYQEMS